MKLFLPSHILEASYSTDKVPHLSGVCQEDGSHSIRTEYLHDTNHTFLGLLAKIKCSICSYQFNI